MGYWNDEEVKETKDDHIELEQLESECLDELGDVERVSVSAWALRTSDSAICATLNIGVVSALPAERRKRNFSHPSNSIPI